MRDLKHLRTGQTLSGQVAALRKAIQDDPTLSPEQRQTLLKDLDSAQIQPMNQSLPEDREPS